MLRRCGELISVAPRHKANGLVKKSSDGPRDESGFQFVALHIETGTFRICHNQSSFFLGGGFVDNLQLSCGFCGRLQLVRASRAQTMRYFHCASCYSIEPLRSAHARGTQKITSLGRKHEEPEPRAPRSRTKDRSIFSLSNGKCVRQLIDEYPVPKSSSATLTPIALHSWRAGMARLIVSLRSPCAMKSWRKFRHKTRLAQIRYGLFRG